MKCRVVLLFLLALLVVACRSNQETLAVEPTPTRSPVLASPTSEPLPSAVSLQPTNTPTATATSQPPSPTPEPKAIDALEFDCETITDITVAECDMLLSFFNSTDGQNWTLVADDYNSLWFTNTEACGWKGVSCNEVDEGEQTVVSGVGLKNAGLNGRFPPNFTLENLEYFDVSLNPYLVGPLPENLNYSRLFKLFIGNTRLQGALPTSLFVSERNSFLIISGYHTNVCLPTDPEFHIKTARENQDRIQWPGITYCDDGLIFDCSQVKTIPISECEAIVYFFQMHFGDFWKNNWLLSDNPCTWTGITCTNGHITKLIKPDNNYYGNAFTALVGISQFNTDAFPDLSALTQLTHLDLGIAFDDYCSELRYCPHYLIGSVVYIGGALPEWVGSLSNLEYIDLSGHPLHGEIPESWGALSNLHTLNLNETLVNGRLPLSLKNTALTAFQIPDLLCAPNSPPFREWLDTATDDAPYPICAEELNTDPFTNCAHIVGVPAHECEALVAFYNAHNGENWVNQAGWLKTNAPCTWFGLACENGHISSVRLLMLDQFNNPRTLRNPLTGVLGELSELKEIRLKGFQLGLLPSNWGNLAQLESISIPASGIIGTIPAEWGTLSNLRELDLAHNKMTGELPATIGNWSKLERIDLSVHFAEDYDSGLTGEIPEEIRQWKAIKEINFAYNDLTGNPLDIFTHLTTLEQLDLDANEFTTYGELLPLPATFTNLTNLYTFKFDRFCIPSDTAFVEWNRTIWMNYGSGLAHDRCESESADLKAYLPPFKCTHFYHHSFECSVLHEIRVLNDLSGLQGWFNDDTHFCAWEGVTCDDDYHVVKLYLPLHFDIKLLPENIGYLDELTSLVVISPNLKKVPADIGRLSKLERLGIFYAKEINTLPDEIGKLTNLIGLSIDDTSISELPTQFWHLPNVTSLRLIGNEFTEVPAEIGRLSNLKNLDLSQNNITSLPNTVYILDQLTTLNLSENNISTLSNEIKNLDQLERLNLSGNNITQLPDSLGTLPVLRHLGLSSNHLTELPNSFSNLTKLQTLTLLGNPMTICPPEIDNMTKLETLNLLVSACKDSETGN